MSTKNPAVTRKYTVSYQLGAHGSTHTTLAAAIIALNSARQAARRGGDLQGIGITVAEYRDGKYYGESELTCAELTQIDRNGQ